MNTADINNALQDLIIRLQDAEKGYKEIEKATSNVSLKKWMDRYATERHKMHQKLEAHVKASGHEANVKTSILGDLHRMFIDIKLSATDDDFNPIVEEINRGSSQLIEDYEEVINKVEMPLNIKQDLIFQKFFYTRISQIAVMT